MADARNITPLGFYEFITFIFLGFYKKVVILHPNSLI